MKIGIKNPQLYLSMLERASDITPQTFGEFSMELQKLLDMEMIELPEFGEIAVIAWNTVKDRVTEPIYHIDKQ